MLDLRLILPAFPPGVGGIEYKPGPALRRKITGRFSW